MPAVSKDQQRAAGIALDAKRKGTVDKLPAGAAKEMAKSMSERELEKFAGTKHKGLPEDKPGKNECVEMDVSEAIVEKWEEAAMVREEMFGVEEGEEITSQKSKKDRVVDSKSDQKGVKDSWTSAVHAVASYSRHPLSTNTTGARVTESKDPNSLDILFEKDISEKPTKTRKVMLENNKKQNSGRWQQLTGLVKMSNSELLNEMDTSQLKRYVRRQAINGWSWNEIETKLKDQYGTHPAEIRRVKPEYEDELSKQKKTNEAMLGGISNSGPNPGHRAKMNENPVEDRSERDELESLYSDLYKELNGFRPRRDLSNVSDETLKGWIDSIEQEINSDEFKAQVEAEKEDLKWLDDRWAEQEKDQRELYDLAPTAEEEELEKLPFKLGMPKGR